MFVFIGREKEKEREKIVADSITALKRRFPADGQTGGQQKRESVERSTRWRRVTESDGLIF